MRAQTIDEVINDLDLIVTQCAKNNSALGFFTALYRKVTIRIKEGIINNEFEDNERMEKLDVLFANRYLDAYSSYENKKSYTKSWQVTFIAANRQNLIIMQHLLAGINAHINLDLGIAASETMRGKNIDLLQQDFNKINNILSSMIDDVQKNISKVSPTFWLLDRLAGKLDEKLAAFSIDVAREGAWKFANEYHLAINKQELEQERDLKIAKIGHEIIHTKTLFIQVILKVIRFFEKKNNRIIINILS